MAVRTYYAPLTCSEYTVDGRLLDKIRRTLDSNGRRPQCKGNSTAIAKRQESARYEGPGVPPLIPADVKAVILRTFKIMSAEGQPLDATGWASVAADIVRDMGHGELLYDPDNADGPGKLKLGYAAQSYCMRHARQECCSQAHH